MSRPINIIQISDPHLYADPEKCLLGINTRESFLAVLEHVRKDDFQPDIIVVTGDISQDYSPQSYQFFTTTMQRFDCPVYCLAGNHDEFDFMSRYLSQENVSVEKVCLFQNWKLLLAHSKVEGKVHGAFTDPELGWIEQELEKNDALNTVLFTHHHPVAMQSKWLDNLAIENRLDFQKRMQRFKSLKACGFGHVHQDFYLKLGHIDYYAVPSTCIQFKPASERFAVDSLLPGYRQWRLFDNGQIETQVVRLDDFEMTIDLESNGY